MAKAKKRGLGKGLEALIPDLISLDIVEENIDENKIQMLGLDKIYPNPNQPRKYFNEDSIRELSRSIKVYGIIQPIIVARDGDKYIIIAGERRWRASKNIGLEKVPCIVKDYTGKQLLEVALIENLQRKDLNAIEEAQAYKYLIEEYQVTQEELSEALGKSRSYIANILRLLKLDKRVIDYIIEGKMSAGHGRAIITVEPYENQYKLAKKIISEGLSVRQVEGLVKELAEGKKEVDRKNKYQDKDPFIIEIEESLKSLFGTKVSIVKGVKKGKIEIEYYSEEDLERILQLLG